MNHIILFEHEKFCGDHKHVFWRQEHLNNFNDKVSSLFVVEGNWRFYRDAGCITPYSGCFEPCKLPNVKDHGIINDTISSLEPSDDSPNMPGKDFKGKPQNIIIFEHAFFHGKHRHMLGDPPTLYDGWEPNFYNKVSSIVIINGNWLFREEVYSHDHILGPGIYSNVTDYGIENDKLYYIYDKGKTELHFEPHVILFKNRWFEDEHRHVFCPEPNLNASDDNSFNDQVESIVVLNGKWQFCRNKDFNGPYAILEQGLYPDVSEVGIDRNNISSLQPVD